MEKVVPYLVYYCGTQTHAKECAFDRAHSLEDGVSYTPIHKTPHYYEVITDDSKIIRYYPHWAGSFKPI